MSSPKASHQVHIVANFVLQLVMFVLHFFVVGFAIVNAVFFFYGDAGWGPYASDALNPSRRFGNILGIVAAGVWGYIGMVWTPINAFGLWYRRDWARASTSAYWFLSLLTLLGIPFSIYGLISLGRTDVREALSSDS